LYWGEGEHENHNNIATQISNNIKKKQTCIHILFTPPFWLVGGEHENHNNIATQISNNLKRQTYIHILFTSLFSGGPQKITCSRIN
jgi:hypothetical protein